MAAKSPNTSDLERSCVLCCQDLEVFAVGKCDHPICFRCSTKMRVLCEQKYCAVCREELDKVVFLKKVAPFSSINTSQMQSEKKFDIYFSEGKAFSLYRRLLQHECFLCPEMRPFHSFPDLEQHMRKQHELFCCKLCVKHLKNFTYERKWYNRKDLARHRMHGDPEDTSHRGHPLCKFCDERYLDNDELLKHLRRDHYFCHFCDSDGAQEYYSDYSFLREHFRESHFLCEEGRCSTEEFTHAFRSEIDYKAHKTTCHSKNRAEARQNRQIDIQFSYAPRHHRRNEGVVGGEDYEEVDRYNRHPRVPRGSHQNRRGSWRYKREEEDREVAAAVRASVAARRQEEMGRKLTLDTSDNAKSRKEDTREHDEGRKPKVDEGRKPKVDVRGVDGPPFASLNCQDRTNRRPTRHRNEEQGPSDPGPTSGTSNPVLCEEDFPAFGSNVAAPLLSMPKPAPQLKQEDFPSLMTTVSSASASSVPFTSGMSYTASAKSSKAFHEEDFPALVTSTKTSQPWNSQSAVRSAWASSTSKGTSKPSAPTVSAASKAPKKFTPPVSKKGASTKAQKGPSLSEDEDDSTGMTALEFRNAPTMIDISKLLTAPNPPTSGKINKMKRVGSDKHCASSSTQPPEDRSTYSYRKANSTEGERTPTPPITSTIGDKSNTSVNGLSERKPPEKGGGEREPPGLKKSSNSVPKYPLPEEDFPSLVTRKAQTKAKLGSSDVGKLSSETNGIVSGEDLAANVSLLSITKSTPKLEDEDFPSLKPVVSSSSVSSSIPAFTAGTSYTTSTKSSNAFQEEDFPALVSNAKPWKPQSAVSSNWASSSSKSTSKSTAAGSSKASQKSAPPRSKKGAFTKGQKGMSLSEDEDDNNGITAQEFRTAPTMIDISKMLTTPNPKTSKMKRVGSDKQCSSSSIESPEEWSTYSSQKENAKEVEHTLTSPTTSILSDKSNTVLNGFCERKPLEKEGDSEPPGFKKTSNCAPTFPLPEEDFPALVNNNALTMPPPGFSSATSMGSLVPPPGLQSSVGKPPPGFGGTSSVPVPAEPPVKEVSFSTRKYPVPEDFQQRNIDLINSIKDYLHSDDSKFNEFKSLSGKFRQNLISASEYYKNCRQLLGENFTLIFNELVVLLPDNAKQHELLAAHQEFWLQEKQTSNKPKKNKKGAWKTDSIAPDLDYSVCPTCNQVLAPRDVAHHKTLHLEDDDFPSLQAISRIIS